MATDLLTAPEAFAAGLLVGLAVSLLLSDLVYRYVKGSK